MLITDGRAKMSTAHLYLRLIHNSLQMNEYIINVMKRFFKNNLTSVSKGTIVTGQGFCSNLSMKNISLISWYKANIIWWKDQPNARTSILCCYSILVSSSAGGSTPGSECRRDFIAMHSLALGGGALGHHFIILWCHELRWADPDSGCYSESKGRIDFIAMHCLALACNCDACACACTWCAVTSFRKVELTSPQCIWAFGCNRDALHCSWMHHQILSIKQQYHRITTISLQILNIMVNVHIFLSEACRVGNT